LIQILEVLPRSKALGALELYHEHDQFRQKLSGFNATEIHVEPSESDFNLGMTEEEKLTLEQTPPTMSRIAPGPFKEAFEDIVDEVVILSHHVTSKYSAFKSFVKQSET
jgi:SOS-response transcriptional repressor LexA